MTFCTTQLVNWLPIYIDFAQPYGLFGRGELLDICPAGYLMRGGRVFKMGISGGGEIIWCDFIISASYGQLEEFVISKGLYT